jgi:metal-responsive CopG/Arc/MetJ family transcriptional regulator
MTLIPKRRGAKKISVLIREKLYQRLAKFADKEDYEVYSVVETAIEEFLDDRADDERRDRAGITPTVAKVSGVRT